MPREAYDALTPEQKQAVGDEAKEKLEAAETAVASKLIDALPEADDVTLADKDAVEEAREAYDALGPEQKEKVSPEALKRLTDAEDKVAVLQAMDEVSPRTGLTYNGKPLQLVDAPTTALPEGCTMKYAVTTENTAPTDDGQYTTDVPTATNAGTYYVWHKVEGGGTQGEPTSVTATVAPREAKLAWSNTSFTYDGKDHKPTAKVSNLVAGDTCNVTVSGEQKDTGTYKATATKLSNANYKLPQSPTKKFAITPAKVEAPKATNRTYNGKAQTGVAVGKNCTLSGTPKAVNAGTYKATAKLADANNFVWADTGKTAERTLTWKIAPAKVAAPKAKNRTYNGKAQTGVATGKNYKLSGTPKATKAGSYKATAKLADAKNFVWADTGKTADRKLSWKISPAKLTSIAKVANQAWTGKAVKPKPAVKGAGKTLKSGTDYTLTYKNNVKAGTATVTAKGKGNFTGTVKTTFKIVKPSVQYFVHRQTYGWEKSWSKADGQQSGTTGEGKRLESIKVRLAKKPASGSIQYMTHIQTYGWEKSWKSDGAMSGTMGESKRLEAIRIRLTGQMAKKYDVYYRVHAQQLGWMGWAKNGADAGTAGYSYRLEAIQIVLVPKGGKAPAASYKGATRMTKSAFVQK